MMVSLQRKVDVTTGKIQNEKRCLWMCCVVFFLNLSGRERAGREVFAGGRGGRGNGSVGEGGKL